MFILWSNFLKIHLKFKYRKSKIFKYTFENVVTNTYNMKNDHSFSFIYEIHICYVKLYNNKKYERYRYIETLESGFDF